MQIIKKNLSDTKVELKLVADPELLVAIKEQTVHAMAKGIKVQGFRGGKAPKHLVEKQLDPTQLQSEVIERSVNRLYAAALEQENLRPVAQPEVMISKFVPYETLEVTLTLEVVGKVTLADYKKIKLAPEKVAINTKDVDDVVAELRIREAEKLDVDRAAKNGDQVWIDFTGVDAKTKEPISGADGKQYPLNLGSNTFIPGFETNLVGVKPGATTEFTLTFPKDYGVKTLQNRKVTFTVTVTKVQEVVEPKVDDAFAAKIGPFKTVADMKEDIKKELAARKQADADQKYVDDLIAKIAEKSKVAIPPVLIDEQIDRLIDEQRQNLAYRGQTWQDFLDSQGVTEEAYRTQNRPMAELRVKAGLVLAEVAEVEQIEVTPAELEAQLKVLKARYSDPKMQAELAKPEARRSIAARILTDKTVAKLREYASA